MLHVWPHFKSSNFIFKMCIAEFLFHKTKYFGVRSKPLRKTAAALSPCVEHPPSKANGGTVSVDSVASDQPQCACKETGLAYM